MYLLLLILATKLFGCVVAIDLEALRIQTSTEYVNNAKAKSSLNLQRLQKVSYLETASELVKTVAPGATFKIVPGHYTGSNGLSHVHFKQRFHDVEIDNALFNVNIDNNATVIAVLDHVDRWIYEVYPFGVCSQADGVRTGIEDPHDSKASSFGWHNPLNTITNIYDTTGNNVVVGAHSTVLGGQHPAKSPNESFIFPYVPDIGTLWDFYEAGVTQAFYVTNMLHDLYYILDFTPEAGNFQMNNNVSDRMTGPPDNRDCLSAFEPDGMAEGWSDFYAAALTVKPEADHNSTYAVSAWGLNNSTAFRLRLYSTDMTTNEYTYSSVNDFNRVHRVGTVWSRQERQSPPRHGEWVPTDGKFLSVKLTTDGFALQPCNPSFVQARDAIIDADVALTGGENACEIWRAFAKRGLGASAVTGEPRADSFDLPGGVR
ncbi:hypothetical protein V2G26_001401 [Clonostachys chloroleuca]